MISQIAGKTLPDIDARPDRRNPHRWRCRCLSEELTKSVIGADCCERSRIVTCSTSSAAEFAIPTSLYASLLARLDRPRRRGCGWWRRPGAAIGRGISPMRCCARFPGLSEDGLQSRFVAPGGVPELVFQRGAPPDAVYSFKHALSTQDVAYGSLLRSSRRRLHARIAEALERIG